MSLGRITCGNILSCAFYFALDGHAGAARPETTKELEVFTRIRKRSGATTRARRQAMTLRIVERVNKVAGPEFEIIATVAAAHAGGNFYLAGLKTQKCLLDRKCEDAWPVFHFLPVASRASFDCSQGYWSADEHRGSFPIVLTGSPTAAAEATKGVCDREGHHDYSYTNDAFQITHDSPRLQTNFSSDDGSGGIMRNDQKCVQYAQPQGSNPEQLLAILKSLSYAANSWSPG